MEVRQEQKVLPSQHEEDQTVLLAFPFSIGSPSCGSVLLHAMSGQSTQRVCRAVTIAMLFAGPCRTHKGSPVGPFPVLAPAQTGPGTSPLYLGSE
jgi:hypothetical protein